MAANYAFSGNPQAQSDHAHPAAPYGYQGDEHDYQYPTHNYGYPTAYDQPGHRDEDDDDDDDNRHYQYADHPDQAQQQQQRSRSYDSDDDRHPDTMPQHNNSNLSPTSPRDYNEKALPPGGAGGDYYGARHRPDSIWSPQDRHVFFKRSIPVRCLRTVFCVVVWAVLIIISVVLLVVTFAKPPNVALESVNVPTSDDFTVSGTSFKANGSVNFAVSNPNSFSATIKHLNANLYDANLADKVSIGNGTLKDQKIAPNDNTTIVFPFDVAIDLSSDATELISDVVSSCGITTRRKKRASGNLNVLLDIDAKIELLSVSVNIPIKQNISFACPTSAIQSVVSSLLGSSGSSIISSLLGGGSSRRGQGEEETPLLLTERDDATAAAAIEEDSHAFARRLIEAAQADVQARSVLGHIVDDWLAPRSPSSPPSVHQDSL